MDGAVEVGGDTQSLFGDVAVAWANLFRPVIKTPSGIRNALASVSEEQTVRRSTKFPVATKANCADIGCCATS